MWFLSVCGQDGPHTYDEALTVGESRRVEVNPPVGRVLVRFLEPSDRNAPEVRFLSRCIERQGQRARDAKRESTEQGMDRSSRMIFTPHGMSFS